MPKISIIIPIYNVEEYIDKCLSSIKEQIFEDFEVIMIDDCSKDGSVEIAQKYVNNDSRFKLIRHAVNQGVSAARNSGLDVAIGDWIMFVDSDDWIEPDLLKIVYDFSDEENFDLVWYNSNTYNNKTATTKINWDPEDEKHDAYTVAMNSDNFNSAVGWVFDKAFRHSIIKNFNLRFPVGVIVEDSAFTFEYLTQVKNFFRILKPLYNYRSNRDGSYITEDKTGARINDEFKIFMHIYNFCSEHHIISKFKKELVYNLSHIIKNICALKHRREEIITQANEILETIGFPERFKDLELNKFTVYMDKK